MAMVVVMTMVMVVVFLPTAFPVFPRLPDALRPLGDEKHQENASADDHEEDSAVRQTGPGICHLVLLDGPGPDQEADDEDDARHDGGHAPVLLVSGIAT